MRNQKLLPFLFIFLGLFSIKSFAQSQVIGSPTISNTPVCAGSNFNIEFNVKNGNSSDEYFTTSTSYTAWIGTVINGTLYVEFSQNFKSTSAPEYKNNKDINLTQVINVPADVIGRTDYVIGVSSTNPSANQSTIYVSSNFRIKTKPIANATNSGPVCLGGTLNLTSNSVAGGTYSWTGPNGFTSSEQNPIINNFTATNAGAYNLVIDLDGCSSDPSTTSVSLVDTYIWNGSIDKNWNTPGNWSCNEVPTMAYNVLIPAGLSKYPTLGVIGSQGETKNLSIDPNASLIVDDNVLNIGGTITNNGTFDATNGTIEMLGSSNQTIPANTFLNNNIKDLIINNNSGVTLNGSLEITGYLLPQNGDLNIINDVTLISDASQTALIDGSGNGNIIGTVKLQRYLNNALGYKYFSSPFNSSTVGDFSNFVDLTASFPQAYSYNENNKSTSNEDISGWVSYTNPGAGLSTLEGYAFNFGASGTSTTVELSGNVNNGSFSRQVSNNNGKYTQGFNLVGNPYPSPIDWNASGWTKTNVDDAIYFFNATDQYTGTYSSYVNNVSSTGASTPGIIPSMQGFFIHVSDEGDPETVSVGTLGVNNSVRINDFTQPFYKTSEKAPKELIRIVASINGNSSQDAMVFYFDSFAKKGFDKNKDALKLMNIGANIPNIYSLDTKKNKLSIKALPEKAKNSSREISYWN